VEASPLFWKLAKPQFGTTKNIQKKAALPTCFAEQKVQLFKGLKEW
jgi:hypothetical protein